MKYLDFYYDCMKTGKMPYSGLCLCFEPFDLVIIFCPTDNDVIKLEKQGYSTVFWGSGLKYSAKESQRYFAFTELRQTIVLFLAAMNGEL